MTRNKWILSTLLVGLVFGDRAWAQDDSQKPVKSSKEKPPAKSLDLQFLDDLPTGKPQSEPRLGAGPPKSADPNPAIVDPSKLGSDVNEGDPLLEISTQMQAVEKRLVDRDVSPSTQADQQRIIAGLDALIEKLGSQLNQSRRQRQNADAKPEDQQSGTASKEAGNNSGDAKEKPDPGDNVSAALRDSIGSFWGHLPERSRRQVQDIRSIEFLPKYRKLIEDYYSRLAEERGN